MKAYVLVLVGGAFLVMATGLSGCGDEPEDNVSICIDNSQCSGGNFCIEGVCQLPVECDPETPCPPGKKCLLSAQICVDATDCACATDSECPEGTTCTECECVGTECTPGAEKTCFTGVHKGKQVCGNGFWSLCDAPPCTKHEDDCENGIDDDCDGFIDCDDVPDCPCLCEEDAVKDCFAGCGVGEQTCQGGEWGECVAHVDCCEPGASQEEACGACGSRSRMCPEDGFWGDWSECQGQGLCEAGTEETLACGAKCGQQIRICTEECVWSDWSECSSDGMCIPGDTEEMACGNCGLQQKVCGDDCYWMPWDPCVEDSGCKLGDLEEKACGNCGTTTRSCEEDCVWGDWGTCQDEGECATGAVQGEACGHCGTKEKVCSALCAWGASGECVGAGDCEPGDTKEQDCGPATDEGICELGVQIATCNATCQWGPFGECFGGVFPKTEECGDGLDQDCDGLNDDSAPDSYEPNNTCSSCYWISQTDPDIEIYPTFDSGKNGLDPDDYFCFKGNDDWDWPWTSEHILVELQNQPLGIDGDLHLYKGYSACVDDNPVASAVTIGGADEKINWKQDSNATSTYYVRVRNWSEAGNCTEPYYLHIKGLK